jgi:hypothetical protein
MGRGEIFLRLTEKQYRQLLRPRPPTEPGGLASIIPSPNKRKG